MSLNYSSKAFGIVFSLFCCWCLVSPAVTLQLCLTIALLDIFLHASPRDQESQNNHNPWHNAGVSEWGQNHCIQIRMAGKPLHHPASRCAFTGLRRVSHTNYNKEVSSTIMLKVFCLWFWKYKRWILVWITKLFKETRLNGLIREKDPQVLSSFRPQNMRCDFWSVRFPSPVLIRKASAF